MKMNLEKQYEMNSFTVVIFLHIKFLLAILSFLC